MCLESIHLYCSIIVFLIIRSDFVLINYFLRAGALFLMISCDERVTLRFRRRETGTEIIVAIAYMYCYSMLHAVTQLVHRY